MKMRVKVFIGKLAWTWDFPDAAQAAEQVQRLIEVGLTFKSKAGVLVTYPPHRVNKITRRWIK